MYPSPRCLHCSRLCGARTRRGLCRHCHADPALRQRYGFAPGGYPTTVDRLGEVPAPPLLTHAEPGSEQKLCILAQRYQAGVSLFHPGDRPLSPGARTAHYDQYLRRLRHLARLVTVHPCEGAEAG